MWLLNSSLNCVTFLVCPAVTLIVRQVESHHLGIHYISRLSHPESEKRNEILNFKMRWDDGRKKSYFMRIKKRVVCYFCSFLTRGVSSSCKISYLFREWVICVMNAMKLLVEKTHSKRRWRIFQFCKWVKDLLVLETNERQSLLHTEYLLLCRG